MDVGKRYSLFIVIFFISAATAQTGATSSNINVFPCHCIATLSNDPNCVRKVCYTDDTCYYDYHANDNVWIAGCYNRSSTGDATDPVNHAVLKCALLTTYGKCCHSTFCNQIPSTASTTTNPGTLGSVSTQDSTDFTTDYSTSTATTPDGSTIAIIVSVLAVACLIFGIAWWWRRRNVSNDRDFENGETCTTCKKRILATIQNFCFPPSSPDDSNSRRASTSSMGSSALPDTRNGISRIMEQETVAKKTKLSYPAIGKGRYGAVYLGNLYGDNVAVKIFTSKEEASWSREVRIYQTVMLQHENILRFIAADNKDAGTCTELWLITEYHENGSLFNYLSDTTLDQEALFKIAYSICCGLAHLHTEMIGIRGKPAIAHRDIKSNNILVKKDGSCAIGDLGLAVCYYSKANTIDIPSNERVGTRRYMPPEVIEDTLNMRSFDAFKNADIYSLGLVLWEVLSRNSITGTPGEFAPCFSEMVPHDPSIEEMRMVVVEAKRRPRLKKEWEIHPSISPICKIIRECWSDSNEARLPILRVKKTLHNLLHNGDIKI